MEPSVTAWNLLTASGVMLAFLIGFYTLVGRERKSPYLINSVFWLFLIYTVGAAFDIASLLFIEYRDLLIGLGTLTLLVAVLSTIWRVYKIYMRFAHFVDSAHVKYWSIYRRIKDLYRHFRGKKDYEHNTTTISDDLRTEIVNTLKSAVQSSDKPVEEHADFEVRSAAIALQQQGQANKLLAEIAVAFLKQDFTVQYLTASRHPIEFITFLKKRVEQERNSKFSWEAAAEKVVVIDAYTRHFGFIDSIYARSTRRLEAEHGVTYHLSAESYAGIHSAASVAFNSIKQKTGTPVRNPTLVIYEDCYALIDLESVEQYRVFLRHVLPSERLWDGMFTVFAETAQTDQDWKLLSAYVSMAVDLRTK